MDDLDPFHPAIAAGDTAAFAQFLAAAEVTVRRSLRPFAASVDVEAVVQEACLRLWQVAPRFEPDGRPNGLLRLLSRIARNLALDELKRRRETALEDLGGAAELGQASVEVDPLLRRVVVECLERLPPQPSAALGARLESGGAEPDTVLAERLRMKPNTFFQNVARARRLLADCLEQHGVSLPSGTASP